MRLNLGYRDLPDTILPNIQTIFGGDTPAETQAIIQGFVWAHLRDFYRQQRAAMIDSTYIAEAAAQKAAAAAQDEADWPEEA